MQLYSGIILICLFYEHSYETGYHQNTMFGTGVEGRRYNMVSMGHPEIVALYLRVSIPTSPE